jgi:hypothetical protein
VTKASEPNAHNSNTGMFLFLINNYFVHSKTKHKGKNKRDEEDKVVDGDKEDKVVDGVKEDKVVDGDKEDNVDEEDESVERDERYEEYEGGVDAQKEVRKKRGRPPKIFQGNLFFFISYLLILIFANISKNRLYIRVAIFPPRHPLRSAFPQP